VTGFPRLSRRGLARPDTAIVARPDTAVVGPAGPLGRRMKIRELAPGQRAVVTGYAVADPAYRARLLAMGLTKGVALTMVRAAPLGDPVKVEVRGYSLSLRKAEADALDVEPA
jgi:ferrous iron transport protein A